MTTFQLVVKLSERQVLPGGKVDVTATGPPDMWVGFNIIDKALLMLNNENILKEDTVKPCIIYLLLNAYEFICPQKILIQ